MEEIRKDYLKRKSEKILMGAIHCGVFIVYLFELLVILPKLYGPDYPMMRFVHLFAGHWILINVLISMWKFTLIDAGTGSQILPSVLQPGWRYCFQCEANFPMRSRHCFYCDKCTLVRDHHCVIGSNCVGYKTRRYFIQMSSYMWVALLYANLLNADFVWELYHSLSAQSLLTMFMPLLAWIFGIAASETFFMAMFTSFCVASLLYATAILLFHLKNTFKGRTTHEMAKNEGFMYDVGLRENLKQAFGENWMIAWISPLIPSRLPGDGITFPERQISEQNGKTL